MYKIYRLHEPGVFRIARRKEHKRYEFGNKGEHIQTITSSIIDGAQNSCNEYEGHYFGLLLARTEEITGNRHEVAYCDGGFRETPI